MSYTRSQFANCKFNPIVDSVINTYPSVVKLVPEEHDDMLDSIIKYVICVYDPESPLVKGERDLNTRKTAAVDVAGITDEDLCQQLFDHTHPYVSFVAFTYLVEYVKSMEWAAICALEFKYWESIKEILQPIEGKDSKAKLDSVDKKSKISEEIDKDIKRIVTYRKDFFATDVVLEEVTKKRRYGAPENLTNVSTR